MELAIQDVGGDDAWCPLAPVQRQAASSGPSSQPSLTHQPLDLVQTSIDAVCQHIMPDPAGTIGPVTRQEAGAGHRANLLVVAGAPARLSGQPGMKARARYTQQATPRR